MDVPRIVLAPDPGPDVVSAVELAATASGAELGVAPAALASAWLAAALLEGAERSPGPTRPRDQTVLPRNSRGAARA